MNKEKLKKREELLRKIEKIPLEVKKEVRREYSNWVGLLGMNMERLEAFYNKCVEKLEDER